MILLVDMLELLECLDLDDVNTSFAHNLIGSVFDKIFQKKEGFVNVTPKLAAVIETLPNTIHDNRKIATNYSIN